MILEAISNPYEGFSLDSLVRNIQVMAKYKERAIDSETKEWYQSRIDGMNEEIERRNKEKESWK
jgi:hypothetical protein